MTWTQWIQIVEIPVVLALFAWIQMLRSDISKQTQKHETDLSVFQIKVAERYVSNDQLKHLEENILRNLERIEKSIDSLRKQQTGK